MTTVIKKVSLNLIGLDGNAFALMGAFQRQAKKEKWTNDEIDTVLTKAKSGDYNNLVATLADHCTMEDEDEDEEDDW